MNTICQDCQSENIEEWEYKGITYYVCHDCGNSNRPVSMTDKDIPAHMRKLFWKAYKEFKKRNEEKEIQEKKMSELSKTSAQCLCDSIELNSEFFDEDNEEYVLLKENNPSLLVAYEALFTLAYGKLPNML